MSYDLSRKTFNPLDDYLGVVMQQGRVQLDADWNTMVSQFTRRIQAGSLDTFGPAVVPRETADGFLISGPANAIEIGPGRIYVDGILAENHTDVLKWDARLAELSGTAKLSGADIDAAPSGAAGTTPYTDQPYYPDPPALPSGETYLVYIDVWHRDVTYLQDTDLVDAAIGIDTTARQQTVWQIRYLDNVGAIDATVDDVDIPGWLEIIHPSSARLSTSPGEPDNEDNPCQLPPQAGYRGLENQLYRVQVHTGGGVGTATFKWSRDNAVVASRVSAIIDANTVVVDSLGKDEVLSFHEGDWVEVTDDYHELRGLPGELRRIKLVDGIDRKTHSITLEGALLPIGPGVDQFPVDASNETDPERNTRLIRWDQSGIVFKEDNTEHTNLNDGGASGDILIPPGGTRLFLENGILVEFNLEDVVAEAGFDPEFKVGDYWLIAARSNDASIEILDRAPPQGIHHHYAKLAIVNDSDITDCRTLWPPETAGAGCACTVCVDAELHNNGTATIQQAIDHVISQGGGTVCLNTGEFQVTQPIKITGHSVSLQGQGWQSMLIAPKPMTLLDIGGEDVTTDIEVSNLLAMTSVTKGYSSAISVKNIIGFSLKDCFIANIGIEDGTSQGVQFTGLLMLSEMKRCNVLAEQGIVGPRLQADYLGTMNFGIHDCILACSQLGIGFFSTCIHLNRLDLRNNHIGGCRNAGIELTGMTANDTAVNIEHNLLQNCDNGIISGLSSLRINDNDMETVTDEKQQGNAITLVDGFDPGTSLDQQIFGNRIRNYRGHAISVQAGIGKMMVKQNQISNILGTALITENGGAIEYLSMENNQLDAVDGVIPGNDNQLAAIFLEASVRADISNNVLDGLVRGSQVTNVRAGILISSSSDVRIEGNRMYATTSPNYNGLGAGVMISSKSGSYKVSNNEISRIPENEDSGETKFAPANWLPLQIYGKSFKFDKKTNANTDAVTGNERRRSDFVAVTDALTANNIVDSAPVVAFENKAYVLTATRLVNLGAKGLDNKATVTSNHLDNTSSSTGTVFIEVSDYSVFSENAVSRSDEVARIRTPMVDLSAELVTANNNSVMRTSNDDDIMNITCRHYIVMGNFTAGIIRVNDGSGSGSLPDPWKTLNLFI